MTKEFLVKKQASNVEALDVLAKKFEDYLKDNGDPEWKWLIEPEVLYGVDGWRAYGRIEWEKK